MPIKRFSSKYKVLAKLKHPLWLEKRKKITQFSRQKWNGKKKLYFPRKVKVFDQDTSTYSIGYDYESDRIVRLKKAYKQLLLDKQAFQLYYGARRLKKFQLKEIGLHAKKSGQKNRISPAKVFLHLMENRIEMGLYRTGLVLTLGQARRLLATCKIKVNENYIRNLGYRLKQNDIIKIENYKSLEILARYLKFNTPFFYFQKRESRKQCLFVRKEFMKNSFLDESRLPFLFSIREDLNKYKSSLIYPNSQIKEKTFTANTNLHLLLARVADLISPNEFFTSIMYHKVKLCVYRLLKILKIYKWHSRELSFSSLGWTLQLTGFHTSLIEMKKKESLKL